MPDIAPCLMFVGDQYGRAEEAIRLYVSAFDDSAVVELERLDAGEEPGVRHARFRLAGREFRAMDGGGPHAFTFTPAVSLFVDCDSEAQLDRAFAALSEDGTVLMPLQAYPFSPRFVWFNDRYGVSWQLNVPGDPAGPA